MVSACAWRPARTCSAKKWEAGHDRERRTLGSGLAPKIKSGNHPLRAMVLFAGAGLDSMVKQLTRDALAVIIEQDKGATVQFKDYIERRLGDDDRSSVKGIHHQQRFRVGN